MSEREKLKPEEKVKIVIKYIAGEGAFRSSRTVCPVEKTREVYMLHLLYFFFHRN